MIPYSVRPIKGEVDILILQVHHQMYRVLHTSVCVSDSLEIIRGCHAHSPPGLWACLGEYYQCTPKHEDADGRGTWRIHRVLRIYEDTAIRARARSSGGTRTKEILYIKKKAPRLGCHLFSKIYLKLIRHNLPPAYTDSISVIHRPVPVTSAHQCIEPG